MKYLLILFSVVLIATQILGKQIFNDNNSELARASRSYSSKLQQFLNVDLRNLMRNGDPSRNVPILDPFEQSEAAIAFDNELAKVNMQFGDLYSEDLSTYNVRVASVSIFSRKAYIGLTFPRIYVEGNYSGEVAALGNVDAFGTGEFKATVKDLNVDAEIRVSILGGIKIKYITLKIVLGGLNFVATGMFDDDDLSAQISQDISDKASQYISDNHGQITNFLSTYLLQVANKYLAENRMLEIDDIFFQTNV